MFCGLSTNLTSYNNQSSNLSLYQTIKKRSVFTTTDKDEAKAIDSLLDNNKKWVEDLKKNDPGAYIRLGQTQKPQYLYFGCSDSRVTPNEMLGLGPGEVFVHRNIGNLIPGNDLNALSVLEYAVDHLGVTDIIVTGHYNCGAVRAATTSQDLGILENWLRLIRDVYRLNRKILDEIKDEEEKHRKLVELNVIEQCINIYKTGVVQRNRIKSFKEPGIEGFLLGKKSVPRIHGLVFDTSNGILKRIKVDYSKVGSLESIYGLYPKKKSGWRL